MHYVTDYHLGRYFQVWWTASPERQQAVAYTVQRLYAAAQHQGALTRLKLLANQLTVWRSIAPLPATERPINFPGLTS